MDKEIDQVCAVSLAHWTCEWWGPCPRICLDITFHCPAWCRHVAWESRAQAEMKGTGAGLNSAPSHMNVFW